MICSVEGCGRVVSRREWCSKHYQRWYHHGDPLITLREHQVQDPQTEPTEAEVAWAAGFIEGEGSFFKNGGGLTVRATQVQKEPLERLQKWFGGSVLLQGQPIWKWTVCGDRARRVVQLTYPWFSPRRQEQVDRALDCALTQ